MPATMSTSTGHFAMSHTVTAVLPTPSNDPALRARLPVITTATELSASNTTTTSVTTTRTGIVFQIGRPSSTSQMTLDARMNAAMYPEADHNATSSPMMKAMPAPP